MCNFIRVCWIVLISASTVAFLVAGNIDGIFHEFGLSLNQVNRVLSSSLSEEVNDDDHIHRQLLRHSWHLTNNTKANISSYLACTDASRGAVKSLHTLAGNSGRTVAIFSKSGEGVCYILSLDQEALARLAIQNGNFLMNESGFHVSIIPVPHFAKVSEDLSMGIYKTTNKNHQVDRYPHPWRFLSKLLQNVASGIEVILSPISMDEGAIDIETIYTNWIEELSLVHEAAEHIKEWHFWGENSVHRKLLLEENPSIHVSLQGVRWKNLIDQYQIKGYYCNFYALFPSFSPRGDRISIDVRELNRNGLMSETCISILIAYLSLQPEIYRLESRYIAFTLNRNAAWVAQSGSPSYFPLWSKGIQGQGEIIGIADSGVDRFHCSFLDDDKNVVQSSAWDNPITDYSRRKIVQYVAYTDDVDDANGHGTHVAGTLVGAQLGSIAGQTAEDGQGFQAKIAVFDFGMSGSATELTVPGDVYTVVLKTAYDSGVRIHSNSWGTKAISYDILSSDVDRFAYDYPQMLILAAAGNCGDVLGTSLDCGDQYVSGDTPSIMSPAQAKNVIAVGASLNYGNTDGDIDTVAFFSSRGPTLDGRIKPDVIGPGYALYSSSAGSVDGVESCAWTSRQGTSMSTPLVASSAALVRQYFREGWYSTGGLGALESEGFLPSAALLKAVLINSAKGVDKVEAKPSRKLRQNVQLNRAVFGAESSGVSSKCTSEERRRNFGMYTSLNAPPDKDQGFGRIVLNQGINIDQVVGLYIRDWEELREGEVALFNVTILPTADTNRNLSVTLVWMDPPSAAGAVKPVLHDLNLRVYLEGSEEYYYPNGLATFDYTNNVEKVVINPTVAGSTYIIEISALTVSISDVQYYAIVATGEFIVTNEPPPPPPDSSSSEDTLNDLFEENTGIELTWMLGVKVAAGILACFLMLFFCRRCHKKRVRHRAAGQHLQIIVSTRIVEPSLQLIRLEPTAPSPEENCPRCGQSFNDILALVEHVQDEHEVVEES